VSGRISSEVLAAELHNLDGLERGPDVVEALERAVVAARTLFGVDGAGILWLDATGDVRYLTASDERGRALELAQEELGTGPCVDTLLRDIAVETTDLRGDPRWPDVGDRVAPFGIHAVLGVPVRIGGGAVAALNVFRDDVHEWDESETEAIGSLAGVIEAVLANGLLARRHERVIEQLQYALDHRVVVERAIGVLMGRHDIDPVEAFNRVRAVARRERRKAAEVADDVLAGRLRL
jgi:GAF domain-containing protein